MVKATGLYTITEVFDGNDGFGAKSGIVATLTRNRFVIPKDKTGTITSYDGAYTELLVYEGAVESTDKYVEEAKTVFPRVIAAN